MEKYDVVAMGELLIDFTQNGYSEQENPIFEANPGGAPCNVLAMLHQILEKGYQNLSTRDMEEMLIFANAAASIITTRRGALRVMPQEEEILKRIAF